MSIEKTSSCGAFQNLIPFQESTKMDSWIPSSDLKIVEKIRSRLKEGYTLVCEDLAKEISTPSLRDIKYAHISMNESSRGYVLAAKRTADLMSTKADPKLKDLVYEKIGFASLRQQDPEGAKKIFGEISDPVKKEKCIKKIEKALRKQRPIP